MRIPRLAAPVAACVVAAVVLPASVPASAAAASTRAVGGATHVAATGPVERVLLGLTPSDRGALRALARGATNHRAAPAAALQRALPSAARRQSVADIARSLGLTVEQTSTMSVLVSGRASLVESLFGSARAVAPRSRVQHPLPLLPAALRGQVTVALGGDDHRPAFRHQALSDGTADGTELRTAYGDSSTDPLAPPTAAERAQTIATVQLSGWHSSDLGEYARFLRSAGGTGDSRWPAPKSTSVDDPFSPSCVRTDTNGQRCANFLGDDVEVDLDQQAIYATAPYANQRAYLSGNDLYGMVDSLVSVGDDASNPTRDRHIVAASISWAVCESDLATDPSTSGFYSLMEDTLSYDLATGVTVFAATGDGGSRCDGTHRGVGYPASSPQVIAVGGTEHAGDVASSQPHGWSDSGGGVSTVFSQPGYQAGVVNGTAMRTVPDISALAGEPAFDVLTTSPSASSNGELVALTVFGTSLATPVASTTYALQVAAHGYSWGVGDILPGLYRQPSAFTDVDDACAAADSTCPGWNGVDVARPGYDLVTGLGTPHWSSLVGAALGGDPHLSVGTAFTPTPRVPVTVRVPDWQSYDRYRIDVDSSHVCTVNDGQSTKPTSVTIDDNGIAGLADGIHELTLVAWNSADNPAICHYADAFVMVDTIDPTPTAELSVRSGGNDLRLHWAGSDSGGSGIVKYGVRLSTGGRTVLSTNRTRHGSLTVAARPGRIYTMTVRATDRVGHTGATTAQADDDKALSFGSGWSRQRSSAAFGGSQAATDRGGARVSGSLIGSSVSLYVTTCSSCGKLTVTVSGHSRTIDTYAASTHHRVGLLVFGGSRTIARKVVVRAAGTRNRQSSGDRVFVDAVTTAG